MKRLKLFFACLLMAVLSIGQVWADTAEFTYSDLVGQGTSGSGSAFTGATDGDITMGGVGNGNSSYTQIYGSGTLTFTPLNGATITKIVLEATSSGYIKTWSSSPTGVSVEDKYATWEGTSTEMVTLTNTAAGQARIKYMTVTYTAGTPAEPHTVSFETGTGNSTVAAKEEETAGAGITLPAGPETIGCSADGWTFAGWAETGVASETTTAPTLLAVGANYKPAEDVTLYAVYKRTEEGGGESGSVEITLNTSNFPTSYGTANTFTEYTLEGYKFKIQQIYVTGSGDSKKHQWRASGNGNGTGTIYNTQVYPAKISSIVLTYHSSDANKNHTLTVGSTENPTDGTSITGTTVGSVETFDCSTANADYFVLANGANAGYTTSIKINYGSAGTTYYLSAPTCTPPAVADPVISLAAGEYEGAQSGVTITCATDGAEIRYTTNGDEPTASSTLYENPISVSASQTIKAIAIKDEVNSNIVSAEYTIITTCETPTFSLAEGSYEGTQSVELSCTRAGVEIRYTTNGDEPTASSTLYEGAITVSSTQTIKAIAIKANLENSAVASATYTITAGPDVVLDFTDNTEWQFPTEKTQGSANYTSGLYTITVFGPSANKEGYNFYTSGGSNKLLLGKTGAYIVLPEFAQPIEKIVCPGVDGASGGVTWNVFDGETAVSDEATGCTSATTFEIENPEENKSYTIKVTSSANLQIPMIKIYFGAAPAVKKPSITGNAAFVGSQDVTITCETDGAAIYYTTDATKKDDPSTTEWSTYGTKVTLNASCTLYAAATTDGGTTWSAVASKAFTATPLYTSIEALQGVAGENESTVFVQMTNWVVTATTNIYAYVTDGTGKGMIFFKNGHDFAIGDKLNKAQLQTTLQNYNGTYELKNLTTADFAGEGELVHGATIPAIAKTATEYAALTNANQGVLYIVNNLTYDATNGKFIDDDANEIAYYNKFSIDESALVDGHKYNVTGVAVYYKPNEGDPVVQLCPRTATDLQDNTAYVQIEFNANTTGSYGGTLPTTITNHISGTDYTIPAASLTREDGYYQLGWNTDPAATTALTSLTAITTDQILYAIWKETENCVITFYSNGTQYAQKTVAQNAAYNFSDVEDPTVQGWTFYGWSESEIATEEASADVLESITPTSDTKDLYAVFSRKVDGDPVTQYEKVTTTPSNWAGNYLLVYENSATQGHVWDGTDASSNYKTAGIASGVISTKPTDAALLTIAAYSTGHSILINGGTNDGKYLKGNGKNTALLFGDEADVVTISCESNGTELLFTQRSIRYMDGRFRYYSDEKALGWLYRENTVTPQSDVYTTAPVVRYNITFVLASGEEGTFNPISVKAGENATLPTAVPTKSHNTFLKWSDGVNEYAAGATITNVQDDIELHATWDPESPATVSFNLNGASGSIDAIENLYGGDPYQLPAAPAYDDEHAFAGWSDGVNVYTAEAAMTMTSPAADVEYVAQWDAVEVSDYTLVTDVAQLQAGDKIIIVAANYNVAAGSAAATYRNPVTIGKTASKNKLILAGYGTPTEFTLGIPTAGEYTFNDGDGYMYESAAKSIKVREDSYSWSISIDGEAIATITGTNALQYNATSGQERFTTYASSQQALQLYRKPGTAPEPAYTEVRNGLTEGWYYTMCLDKAVTAVKAGSIWRVLSKAANGNDVILEEAELPLVAGRPYIFRAAASTLEVAYTGDAVGAPVNDAANNGLVGSFSQAPITKDDNNYIIYNNMLYLVDSENVYVGANRAYLNMDAVPAYTGAASAPGRRRVVMTVHGEQTATGCENINASETPVKMIIDGQLYILRGEKMYDATGKLVK